MNLKIFAVAAGVLALAACGDDTSKSESLKGNTFIADSDGTPITITFASDEMRVNGQIVNLYNGMYEVSGDAIKFGPLATTMMMGPQDAMRAEREYLNFLETVEKYSLNDGTLTLVGPDGKEMVFKPYDTSDPVVVEQVQTIEEISPIKFPVPAPDVR